MKNGLNFGLVMEAVTVTDYEALSNKPSINGVPLVGDLDGDDLGLVDGDGTYDQLTAGNIKPFKIFTVCKLPAAMPTF